MSRKSSLLQIKDWSVEASGKQLVSIADAELYRGECVAVVGPNGSGKSSLLKSLCGLIPPEAVSIRGSVQVEGRSLLQLADAERSRLMSYCSEGIVSDFPFPVIDALALAAESGGILADQLIEEIRQALQDAGLVDFERRDLRGLSGGERQRLLLAMSWLQAPRISALDETLSQLDLHHLWSVGSAMKRRARQSDSAVLLVTHEWNFAAQWADRILVLHQGRLVADGHPREVIRESLLKSLYPGWSASVQQGERPQILYPRLD